MASIDECELPGVGHKFTLEETPGGKRIVVVLRNDGRRELYEFHSDDTNPVSMTMSEDEAKRVAVVLLGAYSEPRVSPRPDLPVGEDVLSWYEVPRLGTHPHPAGDPTAVKDGEIVATSQLLRKLSESGLQLVGLVRAGVTLPPPVKGTDIRAGDLMVVLGPRRALGMFAGHLAGSSR